MAFIIQRSQCFCSIRFNVDQHLGVGLDAYFFVSFVQLLTHPSVEFWPLHRPLHNQNDLFKSQI